ncbi:uncharacterized protein LOC129610421 [Condylostylus longicornis]|uniref:uncharacterized protein LOC129610421 n=1 Tax=Condylostylus longicornis TaxID=2530218 RepID=UPI00244DF499|nr:uncharacterized protein LOC129610421 [Condylostylus longicornis]
MKTEEHHNFDPLKPIGNHDDMRTAYYRGHRHLRDPPATATFSKVPEPEYIYSRQPTVDLKNESETKEVYVRKPFNPGSIQNPHLELDKVYSMKDLDEKQYTSAPKPIKEFRTVTGTDYEYKVEPIREKPVILRPTSYKLKQPDLVIDPAKPGFTKHLDMMATTNLLTYVPYTEKGLQQNDILTVWNWIGFYKKNFCSAMETRRPVCLSDVKEELCPRGESNICPRKKPEFPSIIKPVPNSGFTSETRDNYKIPVCQEFDIKFEKRAIIKPHDSLVPYMGMNKIYGSGQPHQNLIPFVAYLSSNDDNDDTVP